MGKDWGRAVEGWHVGIGLVSRPIHLWVNNNPLLDMTLVDLADISDQPSLHKPGVL